VKRPRHIHLSACAIAALAVLAACDDDGDKKYVPNIANPLKTPTMTTDDVSTLISDSGYTKYHITAERWDIYDDTEDPLWIFPTGLELENYDMNMRTAATLVCDSATYYSKRRLWRLDGNVVMVNVAKDTFLTQQLFWDQEKAQVYSDSFIHIVKSERIIEGYGFVSDQEMKSYTVNRPTAIIPMNRRPGSGTAVTAVTPATDDDVSNPYSSAQDRPTAPEPASVRNRRARDLGPVSIPTPTKGGNKPQPTAPTDSHGTLIRRR